MDNLANNAYVRQTARGLYVSRHHALLEESGEDRHSHSDWHLKREIGKRRHTLRKHGQRSNVRDYRLVPHNYQSSAHSTCRSAHNRSQISTSSDEMCNYHRRFDDRDCGPFVAAVDHLLTMIICFTDTGRVIRIPGFHLVIGINPLIYHHPLHTAIS